MIHFFFSFSLIWRWNKSCYCGTSIKRSEFKITLCVYDTFRKEEWGWYSWSIISFQTSFSWFSWEWTCCQNGFCWSNSSRSKVRSFFLSFVVVVVVVFLLCLFSAMRMRKQNVVVAPFDSHHHLLSFSSSPLHLPPWFPSTLFHTHTHTQIH